jgi:hypothetical protein
MRKLCLLAILLAHATLAQARLGMPLVDLSTHVTGTTASIPIWSATDVTMNAGNTLTIHFPTGWLTPTAATFVSCQCVFAKYMYVSDTSTATVNFTPYEMTMTSYTQSGLDLSILLNITITPGPFYLRIDDTAAYKNPVTPGLATLTLSYTDSSGMVTTESKPINIGNPLSITSGTFDGYVYSSANGLTYAVQGALVVADSDTSNAFMTNLPRWDLGPRALTLSPKPTTADRYSTVTGYDGRFKLQVPFSTSTTYKIAALYGSTGTAGTANSGVSKISAIQSFAVSSSGTAIAVTLTGFSSTSPYQ